MGRVMTRMPKVINGKPMGFAMISEKATRITSRAAFSEIIVQ